MAAELGFQGREFIGVDEILFNEPGASPLNSSVNERRVLAGLRSIPDMATSYSR
jgi:hypothetical protein